MKTKVYLSNGLMFETQLNEDRDAILTNLRTCKELKVMWEIVGSDGDSSFINPESIVVLQQIPDKKEGEPVCG